MLPDDIIDRRRVAVHGRRRVHLVQRRLRSLSRQASRAPKAEAEKSEGPPSVRVAAGLDRAVGSSVSACSGGGQLELEAALCGGRRAARAAARFRTRRRLVRHGARVLRDVSSSRAAPIRATERAEAASQITTSRTRRARQGGGGKAGPPCRTPRNRASQDGEGASESRGGGGGAAPAETRALRESETHHRPLHSGHRRPHRLRSRPRRRIARHRRSPSRSLPTRPAAAQRVDRRKLAPLLGTTRVPARIFQVFRPS